MPPVEGAQTTLRDTISEVFDETVQAETPAAPAETAPAETAAPDRPRDEQGRFAEKPKDSAPQAGVKATSAQGQPPSSSPSGAAQVTQTPAAAEPKKSIQRPSTWKKDHWEAFDKLAAENPSVAEYILQREGEFARGVSTYKQEWEKAQPLLEAMSPFMPLLQQYGVQPQQWITNLGNAHRMLALGTPQEKAARFVQLAREYQVPLEQLFTLGQDGRLYVNQNFQAQAQVQPFAQQAQAPDIESLIEAKLTDRWAQEQVNAFASQTDKYPHYEEVKQTMLGLLQAGLADDLEGAYKAAMQHPRHFHLYEAQQQQQRESQEREKAEAARKAAEAARRKAGSPRSGTPTSTANPGEGKKGLRSTIESVFDETVNGRV